MITIPKGYLSEVCVVGGVHQEVDYDVKSLIFVEPKDHLERLHLQRHGLNHIDKDKTTVTS